MADHTEYQLYIPGEMPTDQKYTEDELEKELKSMPFDKASTAKVWRNKMATYVPVWKEFQWANIYAPCPDLDDTEDDIDISWLGRPKILGGEGGEWNSYTFSPLYIPMAGVSGVGKTSLLVSMYTQLPGRFNTEGKFTHEVVKATIADLTKLTSGQKKDIVDTTFGKGTEGRVDYHFTTDARGKDGNEYIQPFRFVDFAGGLFDGSETDPEVIKVLSMSLVSLIVVDAPALMSGDPDINRIYNQKTLIHDAYKKAVRNWMSTPRTVVFVLVKAERFIHDKQQKEMIRKLKEEYTCLLDLFYQNNVTVYATPVETAGGVEFHKYEDKAPVFRYTGEGYKPKGCEIPLKICLKRALSARQRVLGDKMDAKYRWWNVVLEKLFRRKYRLALDVLGNFLKDSTLCDVDTDIYQLLPDGTEKR